MTAPSHLVRARPAHRTAARRQRRLPAFVPLAALLLAACGGGGGGGSGGGGEPSVDTGVPLLALTEANVKASTFNAMVNLANPAPRAGISITEVVSTGSADSTSTPKRASATALALVPLTRLGRSGLAKAAVSESFPCPGGGTLKADGDLANPESETLSTGDRLTIVATGCKFISDQDTTSVSGKVSLVVQKFQAGSPAQQDISFVFENFQTTYNQAQITLDGDLRATTLPSGTGEDYTGQRLSSVARINDQPFDLTWRDYRQSYSVDAQRSTTLSLTARIETVDARLGTSRVAYDFSTLAPAAGREIETGTVKLQGRNSALIIQIAVDQANVQLDADGDGKYEKTFSYGIKELLP